LKEIVKHSETKTFTSSYTVFTKCYFACIRTMITEYVSKFTFPQSWHSVMTSLNSML